LEIQKKLIPLPHVGVTTIINTLKIITIMQKFVISVKEKTTGRDVIPPYIVSSLNGLGHYSERVSSLGFIVIVDSIKEEDNFIELQPHPQPEYYKDKDENNFSEFKIQGDENK
jgi:hypothetical protein